MIARFTHIAHAHTSAQIWPSLAKRNVMVS